MNEREPKRKMDKKTRFIIIINIIIIEDTNTHTHCCFENVARMSFNSRISLCKQDRRKICTREGERRRRKKYVYIASTVQVVLLYIPLWSEIQRKKKKCTWTNHSSPRVHNNRTVTLYSVESIIRREGRERKSRNNKNKKNVCWMSEDKKK